MDRPCEQDPGNPFGASPPRIHLPHAPKLKLSEVALALLVNGLTASTSACAISSALGLPPNVPGSSTPVSLRDILVMSPAARYLTLTFGHEHPLSVSADFICYLTLLFIVQSLPLQSLTGPHIFT
jgi:hypothetical protein